MKTARTGIAVIAVAGVLAPASVAGWQQQQREQEQQLEQQPSEELSHQLPWRYRTLPLPGNVLILQDEEPADEEKEDEKDKEEKDLPLEPGRTVSFTTDEGSWMSVDVSPDGQTIVFDLLGDLYTIPIGGGEAEPVTEGMAFDSMPRFSPDGNEILFVSDRSGSENLWILDLEAEDEDDKFRALTKGKNADYTSPEWAPDGKYVVASKYSGIFGVEKLWLYHVDGGSGIQLTKEPSPPAGTSRQGRKMIGAVFENNGRYIWYASRTGAWQYNAIFPQYQLGVYDRDTGRSYTRTSRLGSAFRPTISPDGKWLVYGTRHETETGLRIRDLATGEERWLAYPVQRDDQESIATRDVLPGMDFTPDSSEVVVSYGGKIWRVPIDGSDPIAVPFSVDVELEIGPEVDFDYPVDDSPEFVIRQIRGVVPSPDGTRIAFSAMDRLYVMDYPDGAPRRLTSMDKTEAMPAWSLDGEWVAFVTWSEDESGHIYKVSAAGNGDPVRLTTMSGIYQQTAWSPDGERIVAIRGPARAYQEATGPFGAGAASDIVWIPAAGGDWTLVAPGQRTCPPALHRGSLTGSISTAAGTVCCRFAGTAPTKRRTSR